MKEKELYLFDLDGTLILGDKVIDGTIEIIDKIRKKGKKLMVFTNNSSKTREQYVKELATMGIKIKREEIITAGYITGKYLLKINKKIIYVVGTLKFKEMLEEMGLVVVEKPQIKNGKYNIDAVVIGLDTELNYDKLKQACRLLKDKNIGYIGANPDMIYPVADEIFYPDCGSIVKMLSYSTKRTPKFLGKPYFEIFNYCLEKMEVSKDETIIIGDRLYTDIACGKENGCETVLVLTGETKKEDVVNSKYQPTYMINSIKDLEKFIDSNI